MNSLQPTNQQQPQVFNPFANMPMLPEMFQDAFPVPTPQMNWDQGLISGFFHRVKVDQRKRVAVNEAELAEAKYRQTTAKLDTMQAMMTFGTRVNNEFAKLAHENRMRDEEFKTAQLSNSKLQLETQVIFYQAKNEELSYLMNQKAYEAQYGSPQN